MRRLLTTILVLAVIVIGLDVAGRLVAQHQAATALSDHLPATADTTVTIHGLSFLWQAAHGRYSSVTIEATDTTLGAVDGADVTLRLTGVQLSASDAIKGDLTKLTADGADLTASIPLASLAAAFDVPGVRVAANSPQSITVTTSVAVDGRTYPVSSVVTLSAVGGSLHLAAEPDPDNTSAVPSQLADRAAARLDTTVPLGALDSVPGAPTVTVTGDSVDVHGQATNVSAADLDLTG